MRERAVLSASGRSPCGSLSLFHPSIIGNMAGRIIYAPFLSAQLPVRGMGMEHRHERIGGGTQGGTQERDEDERHAGRHARRDGGRDEKRAELMITAQWHDGMA